MKRLRQTQKKLLVSSENVSNQQKVSFSKVISSSTVFSRDDPDWAYRGKGSIGLEWKISSKKKGVNCHGYSCVQRSN